MIETIKKKYSVFTLFFLLAVTLFVVLAIILIYISNVVIRNSFINRAKLTIGNAVRQEAEDLKPEDFSLKDPSHAANVFNNFYERIKSAEIIRIKVWDYSGKVIFSDDSSIVGQRFPENKEFREAIRGEVITEIGQKVKPENISEQGYEQLLEVYIPITYTGESVPSGVIEAYFKLDDVNNRIKETENILILTIFSFTLVSAMLFFILFRSTVYQQTIFLRQIVDTDPSLIFVKNRDGKFTLVNRAVADIYGTTVEKLVGKTDADFNPNKDEVTRFLADDRHVIDSFKTKIIPEEPVTNVTTGEVRWFQTVKVPLMTNGKATHILGVSTEITKRKKAEEQMRLQTAALEAAANCVVITDTKGTIQWVNPAFTKLTGYTSNEAIGQSTRLLHSGKQDKTFYQQLWNVILAGQVWHGELVNRRKDGSLYDEEQIITPVKNENGKITNFIAIKQDVTKRKQAEENLKQVNNELTESKKAMVNMIEDLRVEKSNTEKEKVKDEAILSNIGDGLIITDDKGNIIQVNESFENLLGWSSQEVIGKKMLDVVQKIDEYGQIIPPDRRSIHRVLTGGISAGRVSKISKMHSYICKDKSKLPITGVVTPIIIDNKIVGAVQVFRDASLDMSIDKAKTEFVSLASHQLRTPLTSINWYIELLQGGDAGKLNKKQNEFLSEVYNGSQRMVQLVNDLLNVSRLETGRLKIEPVPTDMTAFITEVRKEVEPAIKDTGCMVLFEFPEKKIVANVDKTLLRQVIVNLLTNAIFYSSVEKKGQVIVSLAANLKGYKISIKDNGIGIPKESQGRIFEKFYRSDNARSVVPNGNGLGLYLAKQIMESSGGAIGFDTSGRGTIFYVTIPLTGMRTKEGEKGLEG